MLVEYLVYAVGLVQRMAEGLQIPLRFFSDDPALRSGSASLIFLKLPLPGVERHDIFRRRQDAAGNGLPQGHT